MESWRPGKEGDLFKVTWLLSDAVWLELSSPDSAEELPLTINGDHILVIEASHLFFWHYRLLMAGGPYDFQAEASHPAALGLCGLVSQAESIQCPLSEVALHHVSRQDMCPLM